MYIYVSFQVTLDEANAMLAEFETDKDTAMDTNNDTDDGQMKVDDKDWDLDSLVPQYGGCSWWHKNQVNLQSLQRLLKRCQQTSQEDYDMFMKIITIYRNLFMLIPMKSLSATAITYNLYSNLYFNTHR